jgi:site-specific recombinase XerD
MNTFNCNTYLSKFNDLIELRDLTRNTAKNYSSFLKQYLKWIDINLSKTPENVSFEEIRTYLLFLKNIKKISNRSINAHISQLRFFYLYVLNKSWNKYQIPFMKITTYLPIVLTQKEVHYFIDTLANLKHKTYVALLYSAGLRVSELRHLRYEDVDRNSMRLYIRNTKSRSDRYAILSENALQILTDYWYAFGRPKEWLFPGSNPVKPVASFTISTVVKNHVSSLNLNQKITPHTFRHAFGTHLYEQGTDLLMIQKLLGHKSINSTTIYVHLSNTKELDIVSPFDKGGL